MKKENDETIESLQEQLNEIQDTINRLQGIEDVEYADDDIAEEWEEIPEVLTEAEVNETTGGASRNYGTSTVYVSSGQSGVTVWPRIGVISSVTKTGGTIATSMIKALSSVRVNRKNVRTTGNCTIKVNGSYGYKYYKIYFK